MVRDAVAVEGARRVGPAEHQRAGRQAGGDLARREDARGDRGPGGQHRQDDDREGGSADPAAPTRDEAPLRGGFELIAESGQVGVGFEGAHRVVSFGSVVGLWTAATAGSRRPPREARSAARPRWARTRAAPGVIARLRATSAYGRPSRTRISMTSRCGAGSPGGRRQDPRRSPRATRAAGRRRRRRLQADSTPGAALDRGVADRCREDVPRDPEQPRRGAVAAVDEAVPRQPRRREGLGGQLEGRRGIPGPTAQEREQPRGVPVVDHAERGAAPPRASQQLGIVERVERSRAAVHSSSGSSMRDRHPDMGRATRNVTGRAATPAGEGEPVRRSPRYGRLAGSGRWTFGGSRHRGSRRAPGRTCRRSWSGTTASSGSMPELPTRRPPPSSGRASGSTPWRSATSSNAATSRNPCLRGPPVRRAPRPRVR